MTRLCPLLLLAAGCLCAQSLTIPRVQRAPKFTDFLNGIPREAELVVTNFVQMDPGDGVPGSQPTTAYLSYDDKNIYVGWVCKDDPAKIRARVAKRKAILMDDRVTINIDTFHDHRRSYFFDVNPYAIQMDGITTDGLGDDFSFETLWYSEAKIVSDGYVVFQAIPFKSMRFPDTPKQTWGLALGRFIQRNNESVWWPHISRKRLPSWVAQLGDLDGLENISPGRNFQLIPYGLASAGRILEGPAYQTQREFRGGLDAKTVINDSLTLDLTVNPDFSQVESDEPQVTVNKRFEVFFPERRPFFMENAQFFTTPEQIFHSRRIVDPTYGVRLTGKINRWAIGVLTTDDRAPKDRAYDSVLSLQREFLKDSHVRLMATDREQPEGYNRVASLDTRIRLNRTWFLTAQAIHSDSKTGQGNALAGALTYMDRHWQFSSKYTDRSAGFRSDMGFIPRVDIRELKDLVSYRWRPNRRGIVSWGPQVLLSRNWNHAGTVQDWSVEPAFQIELPRMTTLMLGHVQTFELYRGLGFRTSHNFMTATSEWLKWLAFNSLVSSGENVNYYPATGVLPFTSKALDAQMGVTLRPTPRMRLDEAYLYSRLDGVFQNHIARSKMNYQFTREFSLRLIVDYNGVRPNLNLIQMAQQRRVAADVLFTWLLHPGTALYVGYSDIHEGQQWAPVVSTGRQAFAKLSYLFRF